MDAAEVHVSRLTAGQFIDSVVRLRPRVAAFDCDGTLWSGDAGEGFFDWEIKHRIVSPEVGRTMRARYAEYQVGQVSEDQMCAEMVTMHKGMAESDVLRAAADYMEHSFPSRVFPEMSDLVRRLQNDGCEVWAVSSSNEWVIRAGMKEFGIPENRILAAAVELDHGVVTNRVVRIPSGPGKPEALREAAAKDIDAAFGNSRWDTEMLAMAKQAFAVNPSPELATVARQNRWTIYYPDDIARR